jgi:hypothetical protein
MSSFYLAGAIGLLAASAVFDTYGCAAIVADTEASPAIG